MWMKDRCSSQILWFVIRRENIPVGSFVAMLNATDPDYLQTQSIRLVQYDYDYGGQSLFLQVHALII